jgi:hypothetical protein
MEQKSLFPNEKKKVLLSCNACHFYSALAKPRYRSDGAVIWGYCFKNGDTNHSIDMGKGLAVFLPEASCKSWRKAKESK